MAKKDKCGIYKIQCNPTGKIYIGSSVQIYVRWAQHRRILRSNKHYAPILQRAWSYYGEEAFYFSILEECISMLLVDREQYYVNLLQPQFNTLLNIDRGLVELNRARFALITHCPKGHLYDDANTMINQGKRICRKCNAERVAAIYAMETLEEREKRRKRAAIQSDREKDRTRRAIYTASHKDEKRIYDATRKSINNELRRNRTAAMREVKLAQNREIVYPPILFEAFL